MLDRGLGEPKRILVPVRGPHGRRWSGEIAISDGATVTALRLITTPRTDEEEVEEDQRALADVSKRPWWYSDKLNLKPRRYGASNS